MWFEYICINISWASVYTSVREAKISYAQILSVSNLLLLSGWIGNEYNVCHRYSPKGKLFTGKKIQFKSLSLGTFFWVPALEFPSSKRIKCLLCAGKRVRALGYADGRGSLCILAWSLPARLGIWILLTGFKRGLDVLATLSNQPLPSLRLLPLCSNEITVLLGTQSQRSWRCGLLCDRDLQW